MPAEVYTTPNDTLELAGEVVHEREWGFQARLQNLWCRFKALGLIRQAEIVRDEILADQDRLSPNAGHWATENGDLRPAKYKAPRYNEDSPSGLDYA